MKKESLSSIEGYIYKKVLFFIFRLGKIKAKTLDLPLKF